MRIMLEWKRVWSVQSFEANLEASGAHEPLNKVECEVECEAECEVGRIWGGGGAIPSRLLRTIAPPSTSLQRARSEDWAPGLFDGREPREPGRPEDALHFTPSFAFSSSSFALSSWLFFRCFLKVEEDRRSAALPASAAGLRAARAPFDQPGFRGPSGRPSRTSRGRGGPRFQQQSREAQVEKQPKKLQRCSGPVSFLFT